MSKITRYEFYAKYGHIPVKFTNYYKFTFSFAGELDGMSARVSIGGCSEDIYREDIKPDVEYSILDLEPYSGSIEVDGNVVASFYDY